MNNWQWYLIGVLGYFIGYKMAYEVLVWNRVHIKKYSLTKRCRRRYKKWSILSWLVVAVVLIDVASSWITSLEIKRYR